MNKKNNRKGFTIVELVIVIAVIAILATVMVPTFGKVIDKANRSAALQEAKNLYTDYITNNAETGGFEEDVVVKVDDNLFVTIIDGAVVEVYEKYEQAQDAVEADIDDEVTATAGKDLKYDWLEENKAVGGSLTVTVSEE